MKRHIAYHKVVRGKCLDTVLALRCGAKPPTGPSTFDAKRATCLPCLRAEHQARLNLANETRRRIADLEAP